MLDTQTFGISAHWLSVAVDKLPANPKLFKKNNLSIARKAFLAGSNQLPAVKNWLTRAELITLDGGKAELTDLGRLIASKDSRATRAWTWWLFHLHLCANRESAPYRTFFLTFDVEGRAWLTQDLIVDHLFETLKKERADVKRVTVASYFQGVEAAFRPGQPFHELGLVESKKVGSEPTKLRRKLLKPPDLIVAYGTLLFRDRFFKSRNTVEVRMLLKKGLASALGLNNLQLREALTRISQDHELSKFLSYTKVANLDSAAFPNRGLNPIRKYGYSTGDVQWP